MNRAPMLGLLFCAAAVGQEPPVADEVRRSTRLGFLHGVLAPAELRIDYGEAAWRDEYEAQVKRRDAAGPFRLGNGGWATMHCGAALRIGARRLPAGVWYLGLRRASDAKWSLAIYESAKVLRHGVLPGDVHGVEPALEVPMELRACEQPQPTLRVQLEAAGEGAALGAFSVRIVWGTHELFATLTADVEAVAPAERAPKFRKLDPERVVETASGLRYELLRDGVGAPPVATDRVRVHYVGWGADGAEFDSSIARDQVSTFPVSAVIRGWGEALQLMSPGAVFLVEIPPELGYGQRGVPPKIAPNATLYFWIELLAIDR